jgi:myo-inositol catabolism protein IolS
LTLKLDKYITIPRTSLNVSRICFGGEQLGGFNLGQYNINDTIDAARFAFEQGINFFDTADCYNLGQSEINLSLALSEISREKFILSSKFGVRYDNLKKTVFYDNSLDWINKALDNSLKRLNTDYIDLYQLHHHDSTTPLDIIFSHLEKKVENGKIRYYGVSNLNQLQFDRSEFPHLVTFSNEFSLANSENEQIIEENLKKNLFFLAFGCLGQGILTGNYDKKSSFKSSDRRSQLKYKNFHGNTLERNLIIIEKMKKIKSKNQGISLPQIAVNFVMNRFKNSVVISGVKNINQLIDITGSFSVNLNKKEYLSLFNENS